MLRNLNSLKCSRVPSANHVAIFIATCCCGSLFPVVFYLLVWWRKIVARLLHYGHAYRYWTLIASDDGLVSAFFISSSRTILLQTFLSNHFSSSFGIRLFNLNEMIFSFSFVFYPHFMLGSTSDSLLFSFMIRMVARFFFVSVPDFHFRFETDLMDFSLFDFILTIPIQNFIFIFWTENINFLLLLLFIRY